MSESKPLMETDMANEDSELTMRRTREISGADYRREPESDSPVRQLPADRRLWRADDFEYARQLGQKSKP